MSGKEDQRMAATYIRPYKKSKGFTALETMKECFDYGLNPKKCTVVSSYLCDPQTLSDRGIIAHLAPSMQEALVMLVDAEYSGVVIMKSQKRIVSPKILP